MNVQPNANCLERMAKNLSTKRLSCQQKALKAQIGIEDLYVFTSVGFDAFQPEPKSIVGRHRREPIRRIHLKERRNVHRFCELRSDAAALVGHRNRNTLIMIRHCARSSIDHVPMTFFPWRVCDFEDHDVDAFGPIRLSSRGEAVVNRDWVKHVTVRAQLSERKYSTIWSVPCSNLDEMTDRIPERHGSVPIEIVGSFEPNPWPNRSA